MLSVVQSKIMGFQFDEVYVGTAEERAAKGHADDTEADQGKVGTVIIAHNVGERNMNTDFMDLIQNEYSKQREQVMEHISILREKIKENADNVEVRKAYEFALRLQIDSLKSVNQRQTESVRNLSLLLGDDDDDDSPTSRPTVYRTSSSTRAARCAWRTCPRRCCRRSATSRSATATRSRRPTPTRTASTSRRCCRRARTLSGSTSSAPSSTRSGSDSPPAPRCRPCSQTSQMRARTERRRAAARGGDHVLRRDGQRAHPLRREGA